MFYRPVDGHGLPHDPFKAIVAPRPIGWISTRNPDGSGNLAPYSFFNAISTHPWLVMFSSEGEKDSVTNVRREGEFAVNLASIDLFDAMNASSVDAPAGESEFSYAGLEPAPCVTIAAPRVALAHAVLECKVTEIAKPKDINGRPARVTLVYGEVTGIHVDDDCLVDGVFDIVKAGTVARLGYKDYAAVTQTFAADRPRWVK